MLAAALAMPLVYPLIRLGIACWYLALFRLTVLMNGEKRRCGVVFLFPSDIYV